MREPPLRASLRASDNLAELLKLKNEAEALAIDNKLAEAHAKYRELFLKGQVQINNPAYWDLMERAKIQQDWIYRILLSQHDPAQVMTPPLPGAATNIAATAPSTTRSFVEVHPPYAGVSAALLLDLRGMSPRRRKRLLGRLRKRWFPGFLSPSI